MRRSLVTSLKLRWRTLVIVGGLVAAAVFIAVRFWPESLEDRVARIQLGMTPTEVEAIMGLPHGDYGYYGQPKVSRGGFDPDADWKQAWTWDNVSVLVWFNSAGQVTRAEYRRHPLSLSDLWRLWVDQ